MKDKKTEINPIHKDYKYMLSPRCGAKTRKHTPCLAPAVKGKNRCRMHGGAKGSGAPKGNQNALKHGEHTGKAKARRKEIRTLIKTCREFMADFEDDGISLNVVAQIRPDSFRFIRSDCQVKFN